jgi:beta-mannosidase
VHTFVEDIELALEPNPVDVAVTETENGYAVQVTARSLARDVTLLGTTVRDLEQTLDRAPVLRTANDLQRTKSGVERN